MGKDNMVAVGRPKMRLQKSGAAKHVLSKLISKNTPGAPAHSGAGTGPDEHSMRDITNRNSNRIRNAKSIKEILPDIELTEQILISSILSPKHLLETKLNYSLENTHGADEAAGKFISIVEEFFEEEVNLSVLQSEILHKVLFETGSYPIAIIPESSIDNIINSNSRVSLESMGTKYSDTGVGDRLNFLGPGIREASSKKTSSTGFGLESHKTLTSLNSVINPYTSITDDFNFLKLPIASHALTESRIYDSLKANVSMEGRRSRKKNKEDDKSFDPNRIFKKRVFKNKSIISVDTDENMLSVGHPLLYKLPSEAVIPVHRSATPEEHVGYFIVLDQNGNPVNTSEKPDHFADFKDDLDATQNDINQIIKETHDTIYGDRRNKSEITKEQMQDAYATIIEDDLKARLKNGIYDDSIELSSNAEIYDVMLARALMKMQTKILFIPAQLVTYYAFDYDESGVGCSLLSNSIILASIRGMLMFANTMGSIRNSIGRTLLNVELDEKDPRPTETLELIMHEFTRSRQAEYPLGAGDPKDIVDYLRNSAVDMNVTGNPKFPTTNVTVEDTNRNIARVDSDVDEYFYKKHLQSFGLTPETVDGTIGTDYAANILSSNLLLTKRVITYQGKANTFNTDFVTNYIEFSGDLGDRLYTAIQESLPKNTDADELFTKFMSALRVELPKPDINKIERQAQAFEIYTDTLDKVLAAYVSSEMFDGMTDSDMDDVVEPLIAMIKAHYQRQWLRKNNVLPELNSLMGNEETDFLDLQQGHVDSLMSTMEKLILQLRKKGRKTQRKLDKDIEKDEAKWDTEDNPDDADEGTDDPDNTDDLSDPSDDDDGDGDLDDPSDEGDLSDDDEGDLGDEGGLEDDDPDAVDGASEPPADEGGDEPPAEE